MKNEMNGMKAKYFIYNVMVRCGYNTVEFAKAIGVTESCVSHWITGKTKPSRRNWTKIVRFIEK